MRNRFGPVRSAVRGLTLIELMIGLAVMGVLAALAVPSFSGMFNRLRLTGVANEVAADLQYGRSEAVRRRAAVVLAPASSGLGYQLTSGTTVLKDVSFARGLSFANSATITFDQLRATSTPAALDLRNEAGTMRVNVNAMGRVTMCALSGSLSGYAPC